LDWRHIADVCSPDITHHNAALVILQPWQTADGVAIHTWIPYLF